ncbi:hypothetical protein [Novosphingobium lindaniclasticum]
MTMPETTQSDLVERLREYRPRDEWGDGVHHVICTEAADEIERLAVALTACRDALFPLIPRLGPEGPGSTEEQREYEEIGGAWSMADRALRVPYRKENPDA